MLLVINARKEASGEERANPQSSFLSSPIRIPALKARERQGPKSDFLRSAAAPLSACHYRPSHRLLDNFVSIAQSSSIHSCLSIIAYSFEASPTSSMEMIKKRALEDIDSQLAAHFRKRRRQDQASSDINSPARFMSTSNISIATSSPTLIGSPAPVTPSRALRPSTPSYSSSSSSSETSESASDESSSSSEETGSVDYASTSSADSRSQQRRSHLPSLLPRIISPSTTSDGTSRDSGTYTSASVSDDVSDLSSSSSEDSEEDDLSSSSSGSSSQLGSSSADSALSFSTSNSLQRSLRPHLPVASLTVDNLSNLQARLNALLPKMKDANEVLETERKEGRLDERNIENVGDADGGGQEGKYIEMDLGLGVLEQRGDIDDKSGSEERDNGCDGGRKEKEGDRPENRDLLGRLLDKGGMVNPNSKTLVKEVEA